MAGSPGCNEEGLQTWGGGRSGGEGCDRVSGERRREVDPLP